MGFNVKHKIVLKLLTVSFFLLNNVLAGQNLLIKIHNKTGYKIDSLIVSTKFIGTIESDSISSPISFEKFNFDTGIPYESIFGIIGEKRLKNEWWSLCGTERSTEYQGEFLFELIIQHYEHVDCLELR
jgi:hypothetical protein